METGLFSQAQEQAQYCQVFSNPRRVLILWALGNDEMSVSEISSEIGASLQNTSQHLRLMKDRGILSSRRDGNIIFYRVINNECLQYQDSVNKHSLIEKN
jgi:DNA-binding transcriptional ArsR family regulator